MNAWISIILGALAGYLLPYLINCIKYLYRRTKTSFICGKWFSYLWWTIDGNTSCGKLDVTITKGILSEYKVTFSGISVDYIGSACIETNNLCITMSLKDNVYAGTTFHRYDLSTIERRNKLCGFWISRNGDSKVSCGGTILSRTELTEAQQKESIKNYYDIKRTVPVLNLKF